MRRRTIANRVTGTSKGITIDPVPDQHSNDAEEEQRLRAIDGDSMDEEEGHTVQSEQEEYDDTQQSSEYDDDDTAEYTPRQLVSSNKRKATEDHHSQVLEEEKLKFVRAVLTEWGANGFLPTANTYAHRSTPLVEEPVESVVKYKPRNPVDSYSTRTAETERKHPVLNRSSTRPPQIPPPKPPTRHRPPPVQPPRETADDNKKLSSLSYPFWTRLIQVTAYGFGKTRRVLQEVPDMKTFTVFEHALYLVRGADFREKPKDARLDLAWFLVKVILFLVSCYFLHQWMSPIWAATVARWYIPRGQCGAIHEWKGYTLFVTDRSVYFDPKIISRKGKQVEQNTRLCHAAKCTFEWYSDIEISVVNEYTGRRIDKAVINPDDAKCLQKVLACADIHTMQAKDAIVKYNCASVSGIEQSSFWSRLSETVSSLWSSDHVQEDEY